MAIIIVFYVKREMSFAIICTVCTACFFAIPFGIVLALLFGWVKASQWRMVAFMSVWTALVAIVAINLIAMFALDSLDRETLRSLLGPAE